MDDSVVLWVLSRFNRQPFKKENGEYVFKAPSCIISVNNSPIWDWSDRSGGGSGFSYINFKNAEKENYFQTEPDKDFFDKGWYTIHLTDKGLRYIRERVRELLGDVESVIMALYDDPISKDLRYLIKHKKHLINLMAGVEEIKLKRSKE